MLSSDAPLPGNDGGREVGEFGFACLRMSDRRQQAAHRAQMVLLGRREPDLRGGQQDLLPGQLQEAQASHGHGQVRHVVKVAQSHLRLESQPFELRLSLTIGQDAHRPNRACAGRSTSTGAAA